MKNSKWRLVCGLFILCFVGFFITGGIIFPQTPIGVLWFRIQYLFPPARPAVLHFYSNRWGSEHFNYLPEYMQLSLCERLQRTKNDAERDAILDLYVRIAGSGQERCVIKITPAEPMVVLLFQRINQYSSDQDKERALRLIEEFRRGHLYKPNLYDLAKSSYKDSVQKAVTLYQNWFALPRSWEQKQQINPLDGSTLGWSTF